MKKPLVLEIVQLKLKVGSINYFYNFFKYSISVVKYKRLVVKYTVQSMI